MRFENLRFIGIDTQLHHQPGGRTPFVLASTSRTPPVAMLRLSVVAVSLSRGYPPNVVLQGETVAMWANVRQSDCSYSIDWRDDPPHGVSAFPQKFLHTAHTANFILCHFLGNFANSFEIPLTRLSYLPILFFQFLPTTITHCEVATDASFGDHSLHPHFF